jgi:cytoskeleton protein RodZ
VHNTGKILKEARLKIKASLEKVAAATKINAKILEAIENGDTSDLPPKTFLRGFVQTYASYLKLDTKNVLEVFKEEMGSTVYAPSYGPSHDPSVDSESQDSESRNAGPSSHSAIDEANRAPFPLAKLIWGGIGIAALVGIYFISVTVEKYKRESEVEEPSDHVKAVALPANLEELKPQEDTPKEDTAKEAKKPTKAVVIPKKEPKKEVVKVEIKKDEKKEVAEKPTPIVKKQILLIEALDTVELTIRIDGGELMNLTLGPEEKKTFTAKTNIKVDISDGGAVNITQNGQDRGVPGNLGQPIKLKYP